MKSSSHSPRIDCFLPCGTENQTAGLVQELRDSGWTGRIYGLCPAGVGAILPETCLPLPTDGIFSGRCTGIDPETGLYNFELRPDAVIRTKDDLHLPDNYLFYLGTPTSPLTGGFSLSADYKEFRLSVNGVYSVGAKQFEYIRPPVSYSSTEYGQEITVNEMVQTFQNDLFTQYLNVNRDMFNRWTPTHTDTNIPALGYYVTDQNIANGNYVDFFLTKASYFSLRNLTLGYTIPKNIMQKAGIEKLRVYLTGDNIWLLSKRKGLDPRLYFTGETNFAYSALSTYSIGLNLTF